MKKERKSPLNPRLREARVGRGWSQQELARQVGTTDIAISRWENGSTFPSPYFRQQLCAVFGKTPAELGLLPHSAHAPSIWTVPYARNPFFTGREQLLTRLHERLSRARTAALTQAQALYGLGGIGKTQAAAEYAFRYSNSYTHTFWMRAAASDLLTADFVRLAELLNLPEKDEQDQQQIVAAVKRWLAANEGWLLILDNADDLLLTQEFLPTNHKGYILYTTRARAGGAIAASVEVEQLPLQEGILLLLRWSKLLGVDATLDQARAEDRADAERIVKEMDGLPLALVQAGAYVEETGCSLADYLHFYTTHRQKLLARRSRLLLNYHETETVATTWSLSFQQIEQASSTAADVLRLCAFLAPDAIPEELLTHGAIEVGVDTGAEALDAFELNEALEVLGRYSLVRRDARTHMLSIHRLVQVVLKARMNQETQRAWAERTVRAVNAVFPEADTVTGEKQQYYLPHVQECAALIAQYQLHFPEAARLLYQAGDFLHVHGFYPQSQSLHEQALAIREQAFGSDHLSVAESLNALAVLSRIQGDYEHAEGFHRQALTIREKMLSQEDRATSESLNNLAVLYRTQGKYEQAEPLFQQALSIREQMLGSEHPDTLIISLNLAKLYLEQRKFERAELLLKQALATSDRVLDPGSPLIAQCLNLMARLSFMKGANEQAETLWKRSLAIVEKAFGAEHPATAERLNDLAELYLAQGRSAQARSVCQRALSICEKILGSEHPDTVAVRKHLIRIMNKREAG